MSFNGQIPDVHSSLSSTALDVMRKGGGKSEIESGHILWYMVAFTTILRLFCLDSSTLQHRALTAESCSEIWLLSYSIYVILITLKTDREY